MIAASCRPPDRGGLRGSRSVHRCNPTTRAKLEWSLSCLQAEMVTLLLCCNEARPLKHAIRARQPVTELPERNSGCRPAKFRSVRAGGICTWGELI